MNAKEWLIQMFEPEKEEKTVSVNVHINTNKVLLAIIVVMAALTVTLITMYPTCIPFALFASLGCYVAAFLLYLAYRKWGFERAMILLIAAYAIFFAATYAIY